MRYVIPLFIFLVISVFLWRGLSNDPHTLQSALIGKPVPQFAVEDLSDPAKNLTPKMFTGHVSLLNIWATWCITCHVEQPMLLDIARENKIVLYGLNYKDDPTAARQWLKKYGNPFQNIISDPQGKLAIDFGVYGTPETFVIDAQGIIRYRHIGAISPDDWRDKIMPVVAHWQAVSLALRGNH